MSKLHLICRAGLNVRTVTFPVFDSGDWLLSAEDADRMVGGRLYLHEKKSAPSYFGGLVRSWRYLEGDEGRIVLRFESDALARDVAWKGASHGMAWSGGVID